MRTKEGVENDSNEEGGLGFRVRVHQSGAEKMSNGAEDGLGSPKGLAKQGGGQESSDEGGGAGEGSSKRGVGKRAVKKRGVQVKAAGPVPPPMANAGPGHGFEVQDQADRGEQDVLRTVLMAKAGGGWGGATEQGVEDESNEAEGAGAGSLEGARQACDMHVRADQYGMCVRGRTKQGVEEEGNEEQDGAGEGGQAGATPIPDAGPRHGFEVQNQAGQGVLDVIRTVLTGHQGGSHQTVG